MAEIQDAGWKQCEKLDDKSMIKEDEIKVLFDMIDKDGSGSLTKRVSRTILINQQALFLIV